MTTDELQRVIDEHLRVTGDNGKFRITVAKEGMIWTEKEVQQSQIYDENSSIGKVLEIESLQKYILKIENENKDDRLKLEIEDRINRFNLEFAAPRKDRNSDDVLLGQGVRGMMAKGPELRMEIVPSKSQEEACVIKIRVAKGKKNVFQDDIFLSNSDAQRLKKYIQENFAAAKR